MGTDAPSMKIDLLFPVLPPAIDGIGAHTARLATALSQYAEVRILTSKTIHDSIEGVDIIPSFKTAGRMGLLGIIDVVAANPPDWLFVQFNQFSYGRWGLNPFLPAILRSLKRRHPQTKIAWMAHEDFVPATSWKFAIMRIWQRAQFKWLGRVADHIFFSIESWALRYQPWFPGKPVSHLPVGSNIPNGGVSKKDARKRLGISSQSIIVGVFGTVGPSRPIAHIVASIKRMTGLVSDLVVLYVGPDGHQILRALPAANVVDAGVQPSSMVSLYLSAMDLHLAPYLDGVSSRRGAFLAGIQHGVPSVTTVGVHTDHFMAVEEGRAFAATDVADVDGFALLASEIAQDLEIRESLSQEGSRLYNQYFTFDRAAKTVMEVLS